MHYCNCIMSRTSIFFTGATGYIGGSVLHRLLEHPSAKTFDITALVRSPEKAEKLESFGVKAITGSLSDYALLEELTSQAHVIFSTADADNIEAIRAMLRGAKKRHAKVDDTPIFIHTSGTGEFVDDARGNSVRDLIYDDTNVDQIEALPDTAPHRNVDLEIVAADKDGYIKSYIILPGLIYGLVSNPFVDAGIQNPKSIALPAMIKVAFERKQVGIVGRGVAIWPNVSNDDTADLYIVLYDAIVRDLNSVGHGREGYYISENGEHSWYSVSRVIGEYLVELGVSTDPEPTKFTDDELIKYFGSLQTGNFLGSNARCKATRSRSIGWKPKHTTQDLLASIKPEIDFIRLQLSQ
ncbi:hypothetical protein QCA50_005564 [Cerrena zonata]|uniref:NmrA-like domain-containing protein n=1 Tax=Cerrena zonata TaxID=2478898 RepID=A0AAW0GLK0_9APHY